MPSDLKSETARANGAKSRGPTTPEGREKSSHNAIKHGFTSNSIMVLDCESPDQFHALLGDFFTTYQPRSAAERDLVEEMVAARWRTRRMWAVETGLLNSEIHNQETKIDSPDSNVHLTAAFRTLTDDSRSLALNFRYASRLHRIYDSALKNLRELQQASPHLPVEPTQPIDSEPEPVPESSQTQNCETNPAEPRVSASGPRSRHTRHYSALKGYADWRRRFRFARPLSGSAHGQQSRHALACGPQVPHTIAASRNLRPGSRTARPVSYNENLPQATGCE
jgi:hypothetical protein